MQTPDILSFTKREKRRKMQNAIGDRCGEKDGDPPPARRIEPRAAPMENSPTPSFSALMEGEGDAACMRDGLAKRCVTNPQVARMAFCYQMWDFVKGTCCIACLSLPVQQLQSQLE